jgi:hypothetical protein
VCFGKHALLSHVPVIMSFGVVIYILVFSDSVAKLDRLSKTNLLLMLNLELVGLNCLSQLCTGS